MNGYGSEIDASPPFFWEAIGHKHGLMLHRKIMWRDRYSATGCSPALQAVDSKQAENLSVGKTKSYWTNNTLPAPLPGDLLQSVNRFAGQVEMPSDVEHTTGCGSLVGVKRLSDAREQGCCGLSHIVADFRQIIWRKFL